MSAGKRRRRTGELERFVQLPFWLMDSPAWRSLEPTSRVLFTELLRRFTGRNNAEIGLGRREAMEACGVGSEHTIAKAFAQLVDRGLVKVRARAGFSAKVGARGRLAQEYELCHLPVGGTTASKAFMSWRPEDAPSPASKEIRRVQSVHRPGARSAPMKDHVPTCGAERAPHIDLPSTALLEQSILPKFGAGPSPTCAGAAGQGKIVAFQPRRR